MNILRSTLAVNAGSSALTGLALVAGFAPLSSWLGIPTLVGVTVGIGLLLFAFDVARISRDPQRSNVLRVIAADVTWVLAAVVVIFGYPGSMSSQGRWALGVITVAVAMFAVLQTLGLRRMTMAA